MFMLATEYPAAEWAGQNSQNHNAILPPRPTIRASVHFLRHRGARQLLTIPYPLQLILYAPGQTTGQRLEVARSPMMEWEEALYKTTPYSRYVWALAVDLPPGPYIIGSTHAWMLDKSFSVAGAYAGGFIAVCPHNAYSGGDCWPAPNRLRGGFVKKVGPRRGVKMQPRVGVPYFERKPFSELFQRRMGRGVYGYDRRLARTPDNIELVVLATAYYNQHASRQIPAGIRTDGPTRQHGGPHCLNDAKQLKDGSWVGLDGAGSVWRFTLDGAWETLWGNRCRSDIPIPTKAERETVSADRAIFERSNIEFIGTSEGSVGQLIPFAFTISDDEKTIVLCNSGHNEIIKIDLATKQGKVLCCNTIPHGEVGHAHLDGPRGILELPDDLATEFDGQYLISDDRNSALKIIRDVTCEAEAAFVREGPFYMGGTSAAEILRFRETYGRKTFLDPTDSLGKRLLRGEWIDMPKTETGQWVIEGMVHPNHIKWTSLGTAILACHHVYQLLEIDFRNKKTRWVCNLPAVEHGTHMLTNWITVGVDTDGSNGALDDILVTFWEEGSAKRYAYDGKPALLPLGTGKEKYNHITRGYSKPFDSGPMHQATKCGWPCGAFFGRGQILMDGNANHDPLVVTLREDGIDPAALDQVQFLRGMAVWQSDGPKGQCCMELLYGTLGQDAFGGIVWDEFGGKLDADIAAVIHTNYQRPDIVGGPLADLIYTIRCNTDAGLRYLAKVV